MTSCVIRLEKPGEKAKIEDVVGAAFNDERTPALVAALRESDAWLGLSYVAAINDEPVAHIAFTRGWLDAMPRVVDVLVLSPVSVAPAYQRQGIGRKLITEALTTLRSRSEPLVFLEGNPNYYSRLGFLPGGEAGFLRPSVRIPEAAFQYVKLPGYEPWMTGQFVYPSVFWKMDCVGLRP